MGLAIALIIVGVVLFHAGAIALIVHVARAASGPKPDRMVLAAAGTAIAGVAGIAGGVVLLT